MSTPIGGLSSRPVIGELYQSEPVRAPKLEAEGRGPDFADELLGAVDRAAGSERAAEDAASKFAAGDPAIGIHEVMIAAEKASISVRYATTLKNKLLDAYRELMNTQV